MSTGHQPGTRWLPGALLIAAFVAFFALAGVAHGAADTGENPDVFDLSTSLSTSTRFLVYGLIFLSICLVSTVVPDTPLLVYLFSMSIAAFPGLRVVLAATQCVIVLLRTGDLRTFVPSRTMLLFLLCIVASGTWALYPAQSFSMDLGGIGGMVLQLPLMIASLAALRSGLTTMNRLLTAVVLGAVPGAILTLHNAMAGIRYMEDPSAPEQNQYYMGFIAPDIFSTILLMATIFLMFCLTKVEVRLSKRVAGGLVLCLLSVALLVAGIRSGWISFGLATLLLLFRTRSLYAAGGVLLVLALVAFLGLSSSVGLRVNEKMSSRLSENSLHSGHARLRFWEIAAQGFAERPVLGIGWGCFPDFLADNTVGNRWATHNIFVRVLCELGVVGFLLFAAWVTATTLRVRRSPMGGLVLLLMAGVLVQGLFLDHFEGSQFWFFLGLCEGIRNPEPEFAARGWEVRGSAPESQVVPLET